jgi:Ca-activated chloride channel family protein
MPFNRSAIAASVALLALLAGGHEARAADEAPTAIIVLDGSGSMWGKLGTDNSAKFDAVRDILRQALPGLRPNIKLGLASFGHRRRGTCTDAEVVIPPQTLVPDQFAAVLGKMSATGMGPVVLGLRQAAAAIGTSPATIILINDDVDNCGQDLCTAAAEIAKANPALTVHTISLGLDQAKIQQMGCLARATNGRLYNAQDSAGFAAALDQVIKLAHLDAGAPPEIAKGEEAQPNAPKAPQAEPGLYLSAGLGPDSATLESAVRWRVTKSGADGEVVREAKAPSLVEKLPPGNYDVEARLGLASAKETVEVKADAPTPTRLNLNAGVLRMIARPAKDKPPLQIATFVVAPVTDGHAGATTPLWIGREAQPEIVLPAGEYQVTAENGTARQTERVKIAAATGTTFTALLATGRLELSAARGTDANEPLTDGLTYIIHEDDPDAPGGRREVARSGAPNPAFTLPAGTYYITARTANAEVRDQIAIGPGDVVKRILPFGLARLQLSATLDGKPAPSDLPLVYTVYRLDGEQREVLRTVTKDPVLDLSAGRYRVEAAVSATNVRATADYAVASGQNLKAAIKLDAGHVTLNLVNRPGSGDVYWEIKNAEQHTVLRTSQPQPATLLAPGRYTVMTETGDQQLLSTFEVKAGENRTIDISG